MRQHIGAAIALAVVVSGCMFSETLLTGAGSRGTEARGGRAAEGGRGRAPNKNTPPPVGLFLPGAGITVGANVTVRSAAVRSAGAA